MRLLGRLILGVAMLGTLLVGGLALAAYLVDLDGILRQYKPQALQLASEGMDRKVDLKTLKSQWFPTLGVRLEGLLVGDQPLADTASTAPGTAADHPPFIDAGAVEVGVAVWPALTSLGKDIQVTQVRLERPMVRIVRFKDGTFNFQTIGGATKTASEPPSEGSPEILERLRTLKVSDVAIVDGTVRYEDMTPDGMGTLEIRHIGFEANDVGLGLPLKAVLTAALRGADEPNLRLEVATQALADKLLEIGVPKLEKVSLQAADVPLSILPMQVSSVKLDEAQLSGDVELVPDAGSHFVLSGPLSVKGLRLRQSGKPLGSVFDVALGLSVRTSTTFSSFAFSDTTVGVGPLKALFNGQLTVSPAVGWEKVAVKTMDPVGVRELSVIVPGDRMSLPGGRVALDLNSSGNLNRAKSRVRLRWTDFEYIQPSLTAQGMIELEASAQGALATPDVDADLDISRLAVKGASYQKPGRMKAQVSARAEVRTEFVRIAGLLVELGEARVTGGGLYPLGNTGRVDVGLSLDELDLRTFLLSLDIAGESLPVGSKLATKIRYQASAANPGAGTLTVPGLSFSAGKSRLSAQATVSQFSPVVARLNGRSSYLDLDALLPASSGEKKEPAPKSDPNEPILPASMKAVRVMADLKVKKLIYQKVEMSDVDLFLELRNGELTVKKTELGVFGGRFMADGTSFNLVSSPPRYNVAASLKKLQGADFLDRFAGLGRTLSGELDSSLKLSGSGLDVANLAQSLDGGFSMAFANGRFDGLDLIAEAVMPLKQALELAKRKTGRVDFGRKAATDFRRLAGSFQVDNGQVRLASPLVVSTNEGDISFRGGLSLDGGLDMDGTLGLTPGLVRRLTAGAIRTRSPLPVTFGLGCSLASPCIKGVDIKPALNALTQMYAKQAVGTVVDKIGKKTGINTAPVKDVLKDAGAAQRKAEAEAARRAQEAARRAEARAKAAADRAAKEAAEKAKNKLKGLFDR